MSLEQLAEVQVFPNHKIKTALFLKGPIPLDWLEAAGKLPGKALHVGISLWFLSGVTKSQTVLFNQSKQERYGVKRDAARRGIEALEKAGLISVVRKTGRQLTVTIHLPNSLDGSVEL
jgi:hypothetical protein